MSDHNEKNLERSQQLNFGGNGMDRRSFLGLSAASLGAGLGGLLVPSVSHASSFKGGIIGSGAKRLAFRNAHTGESFSGVYRVGNQYLPDAFHQINTVLRDFRTNDVHPMDPRIIDVLYSLHRMTGRNMPFEIISGYRSPKTNSMLRGRSAKSGVAKKSFHMQGRAIDLRMEGFSTKRLRDLAKSLQAGGVGYYAKSNFIHIDTGDVRSW